MEYKVRLGEMRITDDMQRSILEELRLGHTTEMDTVDYFEQCFAQYMGAKHCIVTSSGTAALYVIFNVLDAWGTVLTSPLTYAATVNAPFLQGHSIEFCDIEPSTFGIDFEQAKNLEYKIALPVHLLGYPCRISASGKEIVQDACEAVGSKLGSMDFATAVSFYPSHTLPVGEMGAILTNDEKFAQGCHLAKDNGRNRKDFKNAFCHTRTGLNFKSNDIMASIALAQLKNADQMIKRRQEVAKMYHEQLPTFSAFFTRYTTDCSYLGYPIICKSEKQRDKLINHLNRYNVESRAMFPLITRQPAFLYHFRERRFPVAQMVSECGLYIPCHQYLTNLDVGYTIKAIEAFKP